MSTLLAFTTARKDRPLYRRDALNSVAYAEGWFLRLNYRDVWISEDVKKGLKEDSLKGCEALMVLCGKSMPDPETSNISDMVVPLRFGTIARSSIQGGVAEIHLELGKRPGAKLFTNSLNDLLAKAPSVTQTEYLRFGELTAALAEEMDWDAQIDEIRKIPEIKDCQFVRMVGFSLRDAGSWPFARSTAVLKPRNADVTLIELTAGRAYDLKFAVHSSSLSEKAVLPIAIAIKGEHVEVAEPVAYQRGSGAIVEFLLAVQRKYASETATLIARNELDRKCIQIGKEGPEFQVILRIRPPRLFWLLLIFLLTLGTLGLNMNAEAVHGLAQVLRSLGLNPLVSAAQPAGRDLFVLLAKGTGGLVTALAAWFAFRRLPVKVRSLASCLARLAGG